jgi:valyl-tRNA synthetase
VKRQAEAQATAAYCLDQIYKLLHPFMPFMTEELWTLTAGEGRKRDTVLALAAWPELSFKDEESAADINWLVDLVTGIRSVRAEMNVPAGAIAPVVVLDANAASIDRFARHDAAIKRLAPCRERFVRGTGSKRLSSNAAGRSDNLHTAWQSDRPQGRSCTSRQGSWQDCRRNGSYREKALE